MPIFKKSYFTYLKENAYYYSIAFLTVLISVLAVNLIPIANPFIKIVVNAIISIITFMIIQFICFHKKEEYKYLKNMIIVFITKMKRKEKYDTKANI